MSIERLMALEKLDEAFEAEIRRVSTVQYNSNEICRHFFGQLRAKYEAIIAELGQEVGAVESFRGSLNSWIMAYPEQCFSEPQPEELFWLRDAKPGLLDRISASMGRHVAKCLINDFDAAFSNFTTSPAHTSEARDACTLGVGDGSGQLFVHGSYEAIKACQALIMRGSEDWQSHWPKTVVVSSGDMCFTADWDGEHFVTRSPIKLDTTPSAQTEAVVGEVVEIGDDDEGQPRILIHTTREAIKNGPPLAFRTVSVAAMRQEGGTP